MAHLTESSPERRSFLTRLNLGAAAVAAVAFGGRALAQTKAAAAAAWEPARHEQDDWMDAPASKHRMVVDTTSAAAFNEGLLFANNFFLANRNGYGLKDSDIAVIVIARHMSTALAFNDAMWAKYGGQLGPISGMNTSPKTNPNKAGGFGIDALVRQGAQFGVCAMATNRIAGQLAQTSSDPAATIYAELTANLVPNAHMAPAGIVAICRAQERGYTAVTA